MIVQFYSNGLFTILRIMFHAEGVLIEVLVGMISRLEEFSYTGLYSVASRDTLGLYSMTADGY